MPICDEKDTLISTNEAGDIVCQCPNGSTYTRDSDATAQAKADAQVAIEAKKIAADFQANILAQLYAIDIKSIRALRTNDTVRMADLEKQAVALRSQL